MEAELRSLFHLAASSMGKCKIYTDRVPESLERPALFVPPPTQLISEVMTSASFKKTYSLNITVFAINDQTAYEKVTSIASVIEKGRYLVPVVDDNGAPIGRQFKIHKVETKKMDFGTAQLSLTWETRSMFTQAVALKMLKVVLRLNKQ